MAPWPPTVIVLGNERDVWVPYFCVCWLRKPHCTPTSREKLRDVTTTRASISTCRVARSSSLIRSICLFRKRGRSCRMIVFVRSSTSTLPRRESAPDFFRTSARSFARAYETARNRSTKSPASSASSWSLRWSASSFWRSLSLAMRTTLSSRRMPRPLTFRITSRAWSQGTSVSTSVTFPEIPGLTTMFNPLISAKSLKMSARSPSLKFMLIGAPVYFFSSTPTGLARNAAEPEGGSAAKAGTGTSSGAAAVRSASCAGAIAAVSAAGSTAGRMAASGSGVATGRAAPVWSKRIFTPSDASTIRYGVRRSRSTTMRATRGSPVLNCASRTRFTAPLSTGTLWRAAFTPEKSTTSRTGFAR